jgi:hypothetical protein
MPQTGRALQLLLVAVAVVALSGCASGSRDKGSSGNDREQAQRGGTTNEKVDAPRVDATTAEVKRLLDDWAKELVGPFGVQRRQQRYYTAEQPRRAARLAPRLSRLLAPLESWGPEGRTRLAELPPTKPVRTAIEVGNAWAQWANQARRNIAKGSVTVAEAKRASELRTEALTLHHQAYAISAKPPAREMTVPPIGATEAEKRKVERRRQREARRKQRLRERRQREN